MATKKQTTKKAAKAAKPAKKIAAKKPAAKKATKPAAKKVAPKKVNKQAKPVSKTVSVAKKPTLPIKKSVPGKTKIEKVAVQPVKKPAVTAPTHHEVKPAIKPLLKTVP